MDIMTTILKIFLYSKYLRIRIGVWPAEASPAHQTGFQRTVYQGSTLELILKLQLYNILAVVVFHNF